MMAILDTVKDDLQDAMRAGEKERVGALRLVLSELQRAAKEGSDDELAVLKRERKRRLEAAKAYREAGREDLADGEESEAKLIAGYLPAELSDDELREIVARAVRESGAESPQGHGPRHGRGDGGGRGARRRWAGVGPGQGGARRMSVFAGVHARRARRHRVEHGHRAQRRMRTQIELPATSPPSWRAVRMRCCARWRLIWTARCSCAGT